MESSCSNREMTEEEDLKVTQHDGLVHFKIPLSISTLSVIILFIYSSYLIYLFTLLMYKHAIQFLWDQFTVSIQITGGIVDSNTEDTLYHQLLLLFSRTYVNLSSTTSNNTYNQHGSIGKETVISPPGFGIHYLKYENKWLRLQRNPMEKMISERSTCETIILTTWFNQKVLLDHILNDATKRPENLDENKVCVYRICGEDWVQVGSPKNRRLQESVILDCGISERILKDIQNFMERKEWYIKRDIPHRRGYLLYGPPGCGKTSFIKAMAGHIGYNICILSLSSKNLTDDGLTNLIENCPKKSIILMEDIDAAFKSREDPAASTCETNLAFEGRAPNALTFRGLLNALDGVASYENGNLICMTTNHMDKLDPALIRCGRVDVKILIDYPNNQQVSRLFKRFYENLTDELITEFVSIVHDLSQNVSVAMIQGLFLMYKDSGEDALKYAKQYFNDEFSIREIKSESDLSGTGLYT